MLTRTYTDKCGRYTNFNMIYMYSLNITTVTQKIQRQDKPNLLNGSTFL